MRILKGIYVLIIQVNREVTEQVGVLGKLNFQKGLYAYVGSAQNNLEKRIRHHIEKEKRKFWHIDYLLSNDNARVLEVFHKQADKTEECMIARAIGERSREVTGFGSSDCNCESHLFGIEDYAFLKEFMRILDVEK